MYIIGLIIYLALLIGLAFFSGAPVSFIDFPGLILILAFTVSMLLASGLLPDFVRGLKAMGKKVNEYSLLELEKTDIALKLAIKLLLFSGTLGTMIGIIAMLAQMTDMSLFLKNLAVALLTMLYSVLLVFILLPVKAKIKAIIKTVE
jgi:flagellar motor component MotA